MRVRNFFLILFCPFLLVTGCFQDDTEVKSDIQFVPDREYYSAFHRLTLTAESEISAVIYLAKFHGSRQTEVNLILEDLVSAKNRGLNVRVLLEKSNYNDDLNLYNREFMDSLEKYGISTKFESMNTTTHSKCVVFDKETVLLGSTNWTTSALEYNNEANIKIENREIAIQAEKYIDKIWEGR